MDKHVIPAKAENRGPQALSGARCRPILSGQEVTACLLETPACAGATVRSWI
jgi:hypothetical protein